MTRTGEDVRDGFVVSTAVRARRGFRDTDSVTVSTETRTVARAELGEDGTMMSRQVGGGFVDIRSSGT